MRRHADLVGHRHVAPLVAAALLLAGCGGGGSQNAAACKALEGLPASTDTANAVATLRALVAAEQEAAARAKGGLADGLNAALGRAQLALGAVLADPRESGTMSPTATVAASANRALADARALRKQYC